MDTAHQNSQKVLVTEVGSLLGFSIAQLLLKQGKQVFGVSRISPPTEILQDPNFTLLDVDLAQPFPENLPKFNLIVHLLHESTQTLKKFLPGNSLLPATNHIISQAKDGVRVLLMAPLETSNNFYEKLTNDEKVRENLEIFLCGDIYGPHEPYIEAVKNHPHTYRHHTRHFYYHNELTSIIAQAVTGDKIILEDEGLSNVFPTYIEDAINAFEHFEKGDNSKKVKVVVSESAVSALSCAYDIQKIARISLDKELKLYFSGPEKHIEKEPQPVIHIDSLGFKPQTKFEEGLEKTLAKYKEEKGDAEVIMQNNHQSRLEDIQRRYQEHIQKPRESSIKKITSKIPVNKSHFKAKRVILVLLILLMLTLSKTALDIFLGFSSAKIAASALESGDFALAEKKSGSSGRSFKAAGNKIKLITLPAVPVFSSQVTAINNAFESAHTGAKALNFFAKGAQVLSADLKTIASAEKEKTSLEIETATVNFQEAYLYSTQAASLALLSNQANFSLLGSFKYFENQFLQLSTLSESAAQLVNFVPRFIGEADKKTYLVLIQNNNELRPGGGFISSFSEISFENGRLSQIKVDDSAKIDSQLDEQVKPPPQLTEKLDVEQLFLRDSNWSPDFSPNSATARDFYKKETDKSVDGVIAIDLTFIRNLLEITGPISVSNQQISSENLFEITASQPDNALLAAITSEILNILKTKISEGLENNSNVSFLKLASTLGEGLSSKHVLASFEDKDLSSLIKAKSWNNSIPPANFDPANDTRGARDFLSLSEANLGANKANSQIEREIFYDMTVGENGSLSAKLKIHYKNTSNRESYINFLRVYTPFASTLSAYSNGESTNLEDVEVGSVSNLQVFSAFVEVGVNQTKTVEFNYRIPKTIKIEKAPGYNLYVSKQPGTEKDKFNFTFNLPQNIQIESTGGDNSNKGKQNLKVETDLEIDRKFEIVLAKK